MFLLLDILGRLANRPQLPHPRPHNLRLLGGHDLPLPHPGDEQVSDGPQTNLTQASFGSRQIGSWCPTMSPGAPFAWNPFFTRVIRDMWATNFRSEITNNKSHA